MDARKLSFSLNDRMGATEVTPRTVSLTLLKQFADQVGKFLSGSRHEVALADFPVAIVEGSLGIATPPLPATLGLWADLQRLNEREDSLHAIDAVRAEVLKTWQAAARGSPRRHYSIRGSGGGDLVVSAKSNFRMGRESRWVRTERYLRGSLFESGGKASPNIHLQLEGDRTLLIKASRDQLRDDKENRLYRDVLVRVEAEQNLDTGDLRDATLIRFEDYRPNFDPDAFAAFVAEGTEAWRDVADPVAWVRAQRDA